MAKLLRIAAYPSLMTALACAFLAIGSTSPTQASTRYPVLTPAGLPPVHSVADSLFGFITGNMTLTKGSPGPVWHVIGDVFVQPGVTLTIEPGVTLLFEANSDLLNAGDYFTKSELIVRGSLAAAGVIADSIRFVSTSSASGSWGQVKFQPGSTGVMSHCRLSEATIGISTGTTSLTTYDCLVAHSDRGINTFGIAGNVTGLAMAQVPNAILAGATNTTIEQCTIMNHAINSGTFLSGTVSYLVVRNCNFAASGTSLAGLSIVADSASIADSQITMWSDGSGTAISAACKVFRASRVNIRGRYSYGINVINSVSGWLRTSAISNVLITGATRGYSVAADIVDGETVSMSYSTIDSCYIGVDTLDPYGLPSHLTIRNSIISNSGSLAIKTGGVLLSLVDYADLWNTSAISGTTLGSNIVTLNPLYVNPSLGDYHLRSISPCRVLGENGTELGRYGPNSGGSGVGQGDGVGAFALLPVYPNPLNGSGTISFNLSHSSEVVIDVFDSQGRVVSSSERPFEAGLQSLMWEARSESGRPLPSGVYFYKVTAAGTSKTGRLTVAR